MAAPPFACHSTVMPCPYDTLGFFQKLSHLWSSLFLFLQAVFSKPTAVPSWVHSPNPTFEHLAPLYARRHTTQAGVHKAAAQTTYTYLTLSFLQQTVAAFPSDPLKLCLSPSWFPHCESISLSEGTSPHFQLSIRSWSHSTSFFHYMLLHGFFLPVLLGIQDLLLVFSRYPVRTVPFIDVFLKYLWIKAYSTSYSAILTLLPFYDYYLLKISLVIPLH